ncbi:MAG: hypothetical protein ACQESP_08175 [Candidatus Muiribacteriota bacterium]
MKIFNKIIVFLLILIQTFVCGYARESLHKVEDPPDYYEIRQGSLIFLEKPIIKKGEYFIRSFPSNSFERLLQMRIRLCGKKLKSQYRSDLIDKELLENIEITDKYIKNKVKNKKYARMFFEYLKGLQNADLLAFKDIILDFDIEIIPEYKCLYDNIVEKFKDLKIIVEDKEYFSYVVMYFSLREK